MRLAGKVALVTGSTSGIGKGVALGFAREGAEAVVVNYPTSAERSAAQDVVKQIEQLGTQALALEADVAVEEDVETMVGTSHERFGRIDVLVNNAGIAFTGLLQDTPANEWDRVVAVHLRGHYLTIHAALPAMLERGSGRIINTASQLAYKGSPGLCAYTAAKGAIVTLTRSLALELGQTGVTVNCVAPGATNTPILDDVSEEILDAVRAAIPLGRFAEVEDIVPTYVFLASDDARHYQGQCLSPNGGDYFL